MLKRLIPMLLAAIMLLSLASCGGTSPEEVSGVTSPSQSETTIPDSPENEEDSFVVTIESLLAEGDFEKICAEINTVEDFMQLLVASGIKEGHGGTVETAFTKKVLWPDKIVELACRILEEDYEELGSITTLPDNYYFFYVKDNGAYYLYDVLDSANTHSENNNVLGPYTSSNEMVEYAVMKRDSSEGTINVWVPTVKLNAPNGDVVGTTIPTGHGLPELTDVEIDSLLVEGDFEKICAEINTVEDFMQLLVASGIKEGLGGTVETAFTEKVLWPEKIVELACRILEEDYQELGSITTIPDNYYFFYVKGNGAYYLYDVLRCTHLHRSETDIPGPYASYEEMLEYAVMNRDSSEGTINVWVPTVKLNAPNGDVVIGTTTCGVPTFSYAGTTIPVGLGLPELTDEEIDALLAEDDPRKVKDTITTLADFVNYCYRGKFIFGDGLIFFHKPNAHTTSSGYQTLQMRMGQCASMSSCLRYVLDDDYEETGYVMIDKHLMAYILCDGLYYLINPVEYVFIAYEDYRWGPAWLDYIAHDGIGTYCSENFQEIADSLYGRVIGTKITYVYTSTGPGDFVTGPNINYFPKGTTATCWYGSPVNYFSFTEHDWMSQENVVDRDAIVMYPSPAGQQVTFGGIHKDPYTGEQYRTK